MQANETLKNMGSKAPILTGPLFFLFLPRLVFMTFILSKDEIMLKMIILKSNCQNFQTDPEHSLLDYDS